MAIDELIERYLDRELSEEEQERWEEHYFSCDACFAQLKDAATVRTFLRQSSTLRERPKYSLLGRLKAVLQPGGWHPRLVLTSVLFLAISGVAVRGLVIERAYETQVDALCSPFRIASRHAIRTARSGNPDDVQRITLPALSTDRFLLTFTLLEPSTGADSFSLMLVGPQGNEIWHDVVPAEGLTTPVSVVLNPLVADAGHYQLRVGELRADDGSVLESYEIPFMLVAPAEQDSRD